MATVLINCPSTGEPVPTGQHVTRAGFAEAEFPNASFRCPSCRGVHEWSKADAWVAPTAGIPSF